MPSMPIHIRPFGLRLGSRWAVRACLVVTLLVALVPGVTADAAPLDEPWVSNWPSNQPTNQVTALAVAPSNGQTVYAGTPAAVYRSTNGGGSWSAVSGLANVEVLAVDPTNPQVVYAYCWPAYPATSQERGLRKSADGGQTWSDPTGGTSADSIGQVTALAVDPANPQVLLAGTPYQGTYGRILRSADGGATWTTTYTINSVMGAGGVTVLAIHPLSHDVVYAAHDVYHGGTVLRSDDNGLTWRRLASAPEPLSFPASLALDPTNPNVAYVAYQGPMAAGVSIHRTNDGGGSWTKTSNGLPTTAASKPRLVANSLDSRVLYLSVQGDNGGVYRTIDSGNSWRRLSPVDASRFDNVGALVYGGQKLYAGTNEGVWQTGAFTALASAFVGYYDSHDGWRVMGRPISAPLAVDGRLAQYFEKGRLEDHSQEVTDPNWQFMYGLLADQLQQASAALPVGGDTSTVSYATIHELASPDRRVAPPTFFLGGVHQQSDGSVFVPYNAHLQREAGHNVPPIFWNYLNRTDLFPGGWLHDIGLPMTEPVMATVDKGSVTGRQILIQAFQRTILTYDPLNPSDWQVERANVGTDYAKAFPEKVR